MININQFNTLVNPKNEKFYEQDISKLCLKVDALNRNEEKNKINMKIF